MKALHVTFFIILFAGTALHAQSNQQAITGV